MRSLYFCSLLSFKAVILQECFLKGISGILKVLQSVETLSLPCFCLRCMNMKTSYKRFVRDYKVLHAGRKNTK